MRTFFIVTSALMLSAAPAHAQLLGGGGGLGGAIGGTLGGTLGGAGSIGSMGSPIDTVTSATSGTLRGAASTSGSQSVDRHTGQVHADRSASANGALSQTVATPARMIDGTTTGSASGSGSGALDAQLIGTDAVRGTAQSVRGTASGVASNALGSTRGLTSSLTGQLSSSGSASGSAQGAGTLGPIAGSGSAEGSASGGFSVTRGMRVLSPDGNPIGKVRQLFTNGRGEIQQMLVKVGNQTALLPASNFSVAGNAVTSAMTQGQIMQLASEQHSTANAKQS